jgi:hypothetical protein
MAILALLSFLAGTVLGMRLRVLVLVPATACVLPIALAVGISRLEALGSVTLLVVATVAILQIGYLAGIAIRRSLAAAQTSRRRDISVTHSQALPHNAS